MDENVKKRNEVLAQTVIKGLQSRNMSGYYAEDKEAALKHALELIDEERPFKDDSKRGTSGFI